MNTHDTEPGTDQPGEPDRTDETGDAGALDDPVVGGVVTAEQPGRTERPDEIDELAAEPVVVDLDESDVETLDEPAAADEGDGSVLVTESAPGSVLPPEEPVEAEGRPEALLEPVGPGTALDPGTGSYQERWSAIQGAFVDEPLRAVEGAGALVEQMWHDFERSMTEQREALDRGWADDSATDDLRDAFKRYRAMFTRLTGLLEDQGPR